MMGTFYAIIIGVVASLIAWWSVNILLIPKFDVTELLYNNVSRPYVKIWNKSWHGLNVYDVKCYIFYYFVNSEKPFFSREDITKPLLTRGNRYKNAAIVKLDGDEHLIDFFHDGNRLLITVTGQNRFGVKQVFQKEIIVHNTSI